MEESEAARLASFSAFEKKFNSHILQFAVSPNS